MFSPNSSRLDGSVTAFVGSRVVWKQMQVPCFAACCKHPNS